MRSTFRVRTRRLAWLYILANAVAMVVWTVVGAYWLSNSADGMIPGYRGSPVEQVSWYAVGSTLFTTAAIGIPIIVAGVAVLAIAHKVTKARVLAGS